jgi:hypothetical protein
VPKFLVQQQKNQNSVIREIRRAPLNPEGQRSVFNWGAKRTTKLLLLPTLYIKTSRKYPF